MVTRGGELVQLSRTEWLLLQHLAANAGKVVLHTELLTKVWGPEYRDDLQYLRVWVSRVRRKLGAKPGEPGRIKTFQGIGYLLDVDAGRPRRTRATATAAVRATLAVRATAIRPAGGSRRPVPARPNRTRSTRTAPASCRGTGTATTSPGPAGKVSGPRRGTRAACFVKKTPRHWRLRV